MLTMANAITFTITSSGENHAVYLAQDDTVPTTIHGVFNGAAHDLINCTASVDGKSISGDVKVLFFDDSVLIALSDTEVTIEVYGYGDIGGAVSASDSQALVAFALACKLPV
jgi:hypothetical protein